MSRQTASLVQIGQLLTRAGLLSQQNLEQALARAADRGLPIGAVLMTMGCLEQRELRAAVEAQSMVNDGVIASELAVHALAQAAHDGTSVHDALRLMGWRPRNHEARNKLGELLLDAELLDSRQLAECLSISMETGLPLRRAVAFKRYVAEELLTAALRAQRVVREGLIAREEAIAALKEVKRRSATLGTSLEQNPVYKARGKRSTPVGFLLVEAGYISEEGLMRCFEISESGARSLTDTMVEQGYVSRRLADACFQAQQMVDSRLCSNEVAARALKMVQEKELSLHSCIARAGYPEITKATRTMMKEVLVLSRMGTSAQISKLATDDFQTFDQLVHGVHAATGTTTHMVEALARSLYLMEHKMLNAEDAAMGLHFCRKNTASLDFALTNIGWSPQPGKAG